MRNYSHKKIIDKLLWSFGIVLSLSGSGLYAQTTPHLQSDSGQSIPDTLLFKLQKGQAAITEINAANTKGYGSAEVRADLANIREDIDPIKKDIRTARKVLDPKTLISYNLILKNSQDKLDGWQKTLSKGSNDLQRMSREVVALSNDTLLSVKAHDRTAKTLYTQQLVDIKLKLQAAGKANSASLDTVSHLLADVSAVYLDITSLQANISERLEASGKSLLGKESPYIWSAQSAAEEDSISQLLASSYAGQNKILGYFLSSSWDNRILVILAGGLFFLWVFFNFRKAALPVLKEKIGEPVYTHLASLPVVAALLVTINLIPMFEPDAPSPYIEIIEILLVALLSIQFWSGLSGKELRYWFLIVALYLVILLSIAAVHNGQGMRLWLMAVNACSLYMGIRLYGRIQSAQIHKRFIKPVIVIYLLLNILAILLNCFGRVSLAKIYSVTAIIGLIQVIGLAVFVQVLTDALELQIKVSSCNGGLFSRIDLTKARAAFKKALAVVSVVLWLLVFLINLSISGGVFAFFHQVLTRTRSFGSVNFTLSNVLFFAVILYISNILQKYIGILFGERSVGYENVVEHKSSKLTLIRLVIALAGVLLAVTASGIPLDKLTVVLGALSVGIGLGMQNIVNNFVSGIILIFEKPFEIGDFIELADRKGKIQEIGIRSSRMLTQQGSQVVIPNADLISNRFVNWTINTAYIKSELLIKVPMATDLNKITAIIGEEIRQSGHGVENMPPEILINAVLADTMELKVQVWITSVYIEAAFKSQLFAGIILRLRQAEIKIM